MAYTVRQVKTRFVVCDKAGREVSRHPSRATAEWQQARLNAAEPPEPKRKPVKGKGG